MPFSTEDKLRIAQAVAKVERMVRNPYVPQARYCGGGEPELRFKLYSAHTIPKFGVFNSYEGGTNTTAPFEERSILIARALDYIYNVRHVYIARQERDTSGVGQCWAANREPRWAYWAKNLHSYPINCLCGPIPDTAGSDYRYKMGPWLPGGFCVLDAAIQKYEDDPERWAIQVAHVDSLAPLWCKATGPWTKATPTRYAYDSVEVRPCSPPDTNTGDVVAYNGSDVVPTYGTDPLPDITFNVRLPLVGTTDTSSAPTTRDPSIATGQVFQYRLNVDRFSAQMHFVAADATVYDDALGSVRAWKTFDAGTGAPKDIPAGWQILSTAVGRKLVGYNSGDPLYRPMGKQGTHSYTLGAVPDSYLTTAWIERVMNT